MNSTLLAGRTFSEQDVTMRRRLGVVNEAFVKMYHPNGDPIGRVITCAISGSRRSTEPTTRSKSSA